MADVRMQIGRNPAGPRGRMASSCNPDCTRKVAEQQKFKKMSQKNTQKYHKKKGRMAFSCNPDCTRQVAEQKKNKYKKNTKISQKNIKKREN